MCPAPALTVTSFTVFDMPAHGARNREGKKSCLFVSRIVLILRYGRQFKFINTPKRAIDINIRRLSAGCICIGLVKKNTGPASLVHSVRMARGCVANIDEKWSKVRLGLGCINEKLIKSNEIKEND